VGDGVFGDCTNLYYIGVAAQNTYYTSINGVLYDIGLDELVEFPPGLNGNAVIPATVTTIASYAFDAASKVANLFFSGNAPTVDLTAFSGSTPAIYYVPGASGWSNTFGGLPTMLWNPQIQTQAANFGFQNNQFGFRITGNNNLPITVAFSTNLASGTWTPLQSFTLLGGFYYFSDPDSASYSNRFYNIIFP